jgi:hypothetical protein
MPLLASLKSLLINKQKPSPTMDVTHSETQRLLTLEQQQETVIWIDKFKPLGWDQTVIRPATSRR